MKKKLEGLTRGTKQSGTDSRENEDYIHKDGRVDGIKGRQSQKNAGGKKQDTTQGHEVGVWKERSGDYTKQKWTK